MSKKIEWHSPQCKKRAKTRLGGCWCYLIPVNRRKELEDPK